MGILSDLLKKQNELTRKAVLDSIAAYVQQARKKTNTQGKGVRLHDAPEMVNAFDSDNPVVFDAAFENAAANTVSYDTSLTEYKELSTDVLIDILAALENEMDDPEMVSLDEVVEEPEDE